MSKYPIFLDLAERRVVVIGGGAVAVRKAQVLLAAGARVVVVAKEIDDRLTIAGDHGKAELAKSAYSKNYLNGAVLVIAATNDTKLNSQIYKHCQELEILCNVVDVPELCDFFVPAVVRRGDLQITIGTDGNCPAYAGHLRKKLEQIFTETHGEFLAELEVIRKRIIQGISDPAERKALLGHLVDDKSFKYFARNGAVNWHAQAEKIITGQSVSWE